MSKTRNLGNLTDLLTAGSTYVTTATPPQFDNSTNLATTAAVKAAGFQYASQVVASTSTALTAATHAGKEITVTGASAVLTLPAASTCPVGTTIHICSQTAGVTVVRAGTDTISQILSSTTTASMGLNDTLTLMSDGSSVWIAVGGSAQLGASAVFGASFGANGYQKLPSGLIIQWGAAGSNASGVATLTLPIAFPSTFIIGVANYLQAGAGVQSVVATISTNSTASTLVATASSANAAVNGATVYFMAIGK